MCYTLRVSPHLQSRLSMSDRQGTRGSRDLLAQQKPAALLLALLVLFASRTCNAQLPACGLSFPGPVVGNGTSGGRESLGALRSRRLGSSSESSESSDTEGSGSELSDSSEDEEGRAAAAHAVRNMCVQNLMGGGGWVGTVRRLHSSRCIFLRRQGEPPEVKAIGKELRHMGDLSLEYEMMATNIDTVLGLQVRPKTKAFLGVAKKKSGGLLSWFKRQEDVMASLASGQGMNVVVSPCSECACLWKRQKGLELVELVLFEFKPGLENPTKKVYPVMEHRLADTDPASSVFLRSAAFVHLLNNIMGSFDFKGGRDYGHLNMHNFGAAKNCFVDANGKFWALDFDISDLGSVPRPFAEIRWNTEQCINMVWGMNVMGVPDLHCTLLSIMHAKLATVNATTFGKDLYALLRSQHFWDLKACPRRAASKPACLQAMELPELFQHFADHPQFPWDAIVLQPRPAARMHPSSSSSSSSEHEEHNKKMPECSVDVPMIWAFVMQSRIEVMRTMLEGEMEQCSRRDAQ
ncbi:hypothetical protein DUNSADRAFT_709 [Dunaliella salina]|uniref:Protein kinase domain-containing protein n=1 Tax=Dunaliella salina TaxID=3046 RepID=A0ABQ7FYG3_DUNSA|nr:hypothetical protein DUNSADRAFT_709 [Dunaliella salina]|eukprot:KAF5827410.1 hypothetical protein DUNSADRAFT_709 [Dunaliella salina]